MNEDPLSFLDAPSKEVSDPLDFLKESSAIKTPKIGIGKKVSKENKSSSMKRQLGRDATTIGTSVVGSVGDLASLFGADTPLTSHALREKASELIPSLAPQSEQEKQWDENLSLVSGLLTPFPAGKALKLSGKGASKAIPQALKGKYKELISLGRELGVPEKALAPFKHGRVTGSILKGLSHLGETAREGVQFAEKMATPVYQKLEQAGSMIPLNQISKRGVIHGLQNIVKDIQKSPALVSESKEVVKFLEEAVHGLQNNPNATVENLMALQKQLGKSVNWRSIKQAGKGRLVMEARDAVMKGIYGMSPKLGREFHGMDKLVTGYKKLAKEVSPRKLMDFASKGGPAGAALISLMTGHDLGEAITTGVGIYFGKKAAGKISGKLLTDPKWVGIKEKLVNLVKKEAFDKIPRMLVALKKKADED